MENLLDDLIKDDDIEFKYYYDDYMERIEGVFRWAHPHTKQLYGSTRSIYFDKKIWDSENRSKWIDSKRESFKLALKFRLENYN